MQECMLFLVQRGINSTGTATKADINDARLTKKKN